MTEPALAAWKLPPIVAAIAVSIVAGFYLGGPGLGLAVGGLAAGALIVMAVRNPPLHPIAPPPPTDLRRHALIVLARPLEDGRAIDSLLGRIAVADGEGRVPEVRLLAPSPHGFLARWTSDVGPGHERAQRSLVLSSASLAKAGIAASARLGDEDVVQSIEDELRSFPATEVILVTGPPGEDAGGDRATAEMESRLQVELRRVSVAPPAAERLRDRYTGLTTAGR